MLAARFDPFLFPWTFRLLLGLTTVENFARMVANSMHDGWRPEARA